MLIKKQICKDCGSELMLIVDNSETWFKCRHCNKIFGANLNLRTMEYNATTSCRKKILETQKY